jgi:hypothetical protein
VNFRFPQYPNGSFPLNSRPLRSFVAGFAAVEPPIPPTPPQFSVGAIHSVSIDRDRRKTSTPNAIDTDDMEVILLSMIVLLSSVGRN